jgi:hypothetical protein
MPEKVEVKISGAFGTFQKHHPVDPPENPVAFSRRKKNVWVFYGFPHDVKPEFIHCYTRP